MLDRVTIAKAWFWRMHAVMHDHEECWRQFQKKAIYLDGADAIVALLAAQQDGVREAAQHVLDTFRKDEAQGYRSKDRQFAIAILGKAFEQEAGVEQ